MKMRDEAIKAVCEAQIEACLGHAGSRISMDRAKAMDYYMGDMDEYLPVEEGRSAFVSRDVLDTVESVLPSLIKMFADDRNALVFTADSPQDETLARQETDIIRHVFWEQNDGFMTLYTLFKDALLSKTGVVKTYFEEGAAEREEYQRLTPLEYQALVSDPAVKIEFLEEPTANEDGTINAILKVQHSPGMARVEPVPPEEFGVIPTCRTPDIKQASFAFHRSRKTASDLIEMGYDRKLVEGLPFDTDPANEERLARYGDEEEDFDLVQAHKSMDEVWVTECYVRLDANDDGIAEMLKVTLAGESPGAVLLDWEEVDRSRLVTAAPVVLTHKAIGLSLADLVMDIQEIRSTVFRGILDNTYLSNNPRVLANELVNFDDLLISRSGGVVRVEGEGPPANAVAPLIHPPLPQETFGLLEVLDKIIKNRTGVGDDVMGLDPDALANINTGVLMQAYEMSRMRIELMARLLAETGVKNIFLDLHELMSKNVNRPMQMKIGQQWQRVDPREWKSRSKLKINIGVGNKSREQRLFELTDIQNTQGALMQSPFGDMVQPDNVFNLVREKIEAHDCSAELFITHPSKIPPKQPPPPPPEFLTAQANMIRAQNDSQRLQIELQAAQMDSQTKIMVAQSKEREATIRAQMEQLKSQVMLRKQQVDEQSQIINAMSGEKRQQAEERMAIRKQDWEEYSAGANRQLAMFQAELQSMTQYRTAMLNAQAQWDSRIQQQHDEIQRLRRQLEQRNRSEMPENPGAGSQG